eukprot:1139491-Pelagomonas_calceolata.AAC.1
MQPHVKKGQKNLFDMDCTKLQLKAREAGAGARQRASKPMELSEDTTKSTDEKMEEGDEWKLRASARNAKMHKYAYFEISWRTLETLDVYT